MKQIESEIQWVIFDLGGIVVPESSGLLCNEMAAYLEISPQQLSRFTDTRARDLTSGIMTLLEMYSDIVHALSLPLPAESALKHHLSFYRQFCTRHDANVVGIIQSLKKSFNVACLTNTEMEIRNICKETGLFDYFQKSFLSVELKMQKPDREIYLEVVRSLGCLPGNIVFIDDKRENVEAANEIGIHGVLYFDPDRLKESMSRYCQLQ